MRKILSYLLCLNFLSPTARAGETIGFVAQVENESLAEESILLVHCLSTRLNLNWEFNSQVQGNIWLRLQERKQEKNLAGTFKNGKKEIPFTLKEGEANSACEALSPALDTSKANSSQLKLAPTPIGQQNSALENRDPELMGEPSNKTMLWVGLGVLAAVGGYFLISHSKQPDHSAIQMH